MKTRFVFCVITFCLLGATLATSQQLQVEGHGSIVGNLELFHMDDSTSLNVGLFAGSNSKYVGQLGNTFVGSKAGSSNISGASNTFVGSFTGKRNSTGVSNTFVGYSSGSSTDIGAHNSFYGTFSGVQNSMGSNNSFFGSSAGFFNSTGRNNSFFGANSGFFNVEGTGNSFFGVDAGFSNDIGVGNSFYGMEAGRSNKSGFRNCFFGELAGRDNVEGSANVQIGAYAGYRSIGSSNVFVGHFSGEGNASGNANIFIGKTSGRTNATGSKNTVIGTDADLDAADLENASAIGYLARVGASNKIRLGNTNITRIEGQVSFSASSDRRLKEDIIPTPVGLEFILDLNPVVYHRKANIDKDCEMGLIAQDLKATLLEHGQDRAGMVYQGSDGYYSVRYDDLVAPIIKAIQELSNQVTILRDQNDKLKDQIR